MISNKEEVRLYINNIDTGENPVNELIDLIIHCFKKKIIT